MRVVICGGGLQGVELCFLAQKVGWKICLIDKNPLPPAFNLADINLQFDINELTNPKAVIDEKIIDNFLLADLIIPATESPDALKALTSFCLKNNLKLAFDEKAYAISSSKLASRDLFIRCNTPIPTPFLQNSDITFPMIAKPSDGSGSKGVQTFHDLQSFYNVFPQGICTPNWLFEAFCEGPSYSVEVCGKPGDYKTYTVTALSMDENLDCCGVHTPSGLSFEDEEAISKEAIFLATELNLHGLMDLEVIMTKDGYKVLEIDARFPSQTPTAVYLAEGINLIEQLAMQFLYYVPRSYAHEMRAVRYGHILYKNNKATELGEHIMSMHGPLEEKDTSTPCLMGKTDDSVAITIMVSQSMQTNYSKQVDILYKNLQEEALDFIKENNVVFEHHPNPPLNSQGIGS